MKNKFQELLCDLVDINRNATSEVLNSLSQHFNLDPNSDTYLKAVNDSLDTISNNAKKAIKFEGFTFKGYTG